MTCYFSLVGTGLFQMGLSGHYLVLGVSGDRILVHQILGLHDMLESHAQSLDHMFRSRD